MDKKLYKDLVSILGKDYVADDFKVRFVYSRDVGLESGEIPDIVVRPSTTEEVSQILRVANRYEIPVIPRGGGITYYQDAVPSAKGGILVDMTRNDKIIEIDEGSMTVTAQAGITWAHLTGELRKRGLRTPFWGPSPGIAATLGGAISVHAMWYGTAKYGAVGDSVVGLEVVLPGGDIIRTGSAANRFARKFARYYGPDMTGLFVGDHGIFGIKTEATLELMPLPQTKEFISVSFPNLEHMARAMQKLARIGIASEIFHWGEYYNDVYARAGFESLAGQKYVLHIIVEDVSSKILEASKQIVCKLCKEENGKEIGNEIAKFEQIRAYELTPRCGYRGQNWIGINALVPYSDFQKFYQIPQHLLEKYQKDFSKFDIEVGQDAQVFKKYAQVETVIFWFDNIHGARDIVREFWWEVANAYAKNGGCFTSIGKVLSGVFKEVVSESYFDTLKTLKKALDTKGIMNPGMFQLGLEDYSSKVSNVNRPKR
jgi:FAD/FMN-containing dehydrogenase